MFCDKIFIGRELFRFFSMVQRCIQKRLHLHIHLGRLPDQTEFSSHVLVLDP